MDLGHSCTDNISLFVNEKVDYIIKKNNQKDCLKDIFENTKNIYEKEQKEDSKTVKKFDTREGKEYYITSVESIKYLKNKENKEIPAKVRIVRECIKRNIDKTGQILLEPEYEIKQYYTSLGNQISDDEVIQLYHKHATCEQYHSEIKTDMDLDRLPSGKFNTNEIVLKLAQLTFNILRMIGQASITLQRDDLNIKRKRIRTVIKDIIYFASKIANHARQKYISISTFEIFKETFKNVFNHFCYG